MMDLPPPRPPREPLVPPGGADLHVADMTATFAADLTLADAQQRLAAHGQWLPIDGDPAGTLGRLVLWNSTGPLRLGYGGWRDLLLGAQFTDGDETLITAGGRTVKNVAGYDLTKLLVGSFGCFGRPVTLTVRTHRRPTNSLLTALPPDPAILAELLPSPDRPRWAVLAADALICGYLGDGRTVDHHAAHLSADAAILARGTADDDIATRLTLFTNAAEPDLGAASWLAERVGFRAAVPPARVREFADEAGPAAWAADAAFGVVVGAGDPAALRIAAQKVGASLICHPENGRPIFLDPPAGVVDVLSRLKRQLDPQNRLAPLPI